MTLCVKAARELVDLLEAATAGDAAEVARLQRDISALEGEADELKSEIRSSLPRGFLLPVPRADLLELLSRQDDIANRAEDVAGLVFGRRMSFPEEMKQSLLDFARASFSACELACAVVNELDELIESSFSGREAQRVIEMIGEVERQERRSDKAQVDLREVLFPLEDKLAPVEVMFLYQVIDMVGDLADTSEKLGHRVQMMLAK
jgi:predicted phosphate transport protein (TIGR00153 family)